MAPKNSFKHFTAAKKEQFDQLLKGGASVEKAMANQAFVGCSPIKINEYALLLRRTSQDTKIKAALKNYDTSASSNKSGISYTNCLNLGNESALDALFAGGGGGGGGASSAPLDDDDDDAVQFAVDLGLIMISNSTTHWFVSVKTPLATLFDSHA